MLYFGGAARPEREMLSLSGLFRAGPGDLEVTATVLNCNEGMNRRIMGSCEALRGYSRLLSLAREGRGRGLGTDEAVNAAVDRCIAEGVLAGYLSAHRAEVRDMLFTIEDEERALRVHEQAIAREAAEKALAEGRAKGIAEGRTEGMAEGRQSMMADNLRSLMSNLGLDAGAAMDALGVPEAERESLAGAL